MSLRHKIWRLVPFPSYASAQMLIWKSDTDKTAPGGKGASRWLGLGEKRAINHASPRKLEKKDANRETEQNVGKSQESTHTHTHTHTQTISCKEHQSQSAPLVRKSTSLRRCYVLRLFLCLLLFLLNSHAAHEKNIISISPWQRALLMMRRPQPTKKIPSRPRTRKSRPLARASDRSPCDIVPGGSNIRAW